MSWLSGSIICQIPKNKSRVRNSLSKHGETCRIRISISFVNTYKECVHILGMFSSLTMHTDVCITQHTKHSTRKNKNKNNNEQ